MSAFVSLVINVPALYSSMYQGRVCHVIISLVVCVASSTYSEFLLMILQKGFWFYSVSDPILLYIVHLLDFFMHVIFFFFVSVRFNLHFYIIMREKIFFTSQNPFSL